MKKLLVIRLGAAVFGATVMLGGCSTTPTGTTSDALRGTSGSVSDAVSSTTPDSKKSAFVNDRFHALRFEAAKGEGENLASLAALLGESDAKEFARWMQANYQPLFSDLTAPTELLARIEQRRHING